MKERVCTLMWGEAWVRYGQKFLESFEKNWSTDVELVIVTDAYIPTKRAKLIGLCTVPGYGHFMTRWKDDKAAQGLGSTHQKADPNKRFWKTDALKWAPQALAPRAATEGLEDGDIFAWFDADTLTTGKVRAGWLGELLDGHDLACLQRQGKHSEIGFWAVRWGSKALRFVDIFAGMYVSGAALKMPESHSAYVFDRALESCPEMQVRNLNHKNERGHVWPMTPLSEFTVHNKGKRKDA